jgi:imidazoleglycerol phosphate synthase glutamine amidotransferase subunit HisH
MQRVVIVDYGAGNLRSVARAVIARDDDEPGIHRKA